MAVGVRILALLAAGAVALGAAGCGTDDGGDAGGLHAWQVPSVYLPPPPPAARAAARTSAGSRASEAESASATRHGDGPAAAPAPAAAAASATAGAASASTPSGAPSDAEVSAELKQAFGKGDAVDRASLTGGGLASTPPTAPAKVVAMIAAANQVARKPYVYGGGHGGGGGPEGVFIDSAYDCSGSVSFALAAAGYLKTPEASGPLMTFGKPGPGKWVSIYASPTHAWMVVAGLRFDTVGRAEHDTRWQTDSRSTDGFVIRHPAGL